MSTVVLSCSFTRQEQNDTLSRAAVPGRLIVLLFHSFEFASSLPPKDLTFPQTSKPELIQYAFDGTTVASEINAQRNKVSLQGEKSSGNAHLRKNPRNSLWSCNGRLKSYGVKLKSRKCALFKREVSFLGRVISQDGYRIDPKATNAVTVMKNLKLRTDSGVMGHGST